ncbi:MAG: 23S rRNA (adenine(2503)-C(2))-methyltransferase RlmN [Parachlamydia sp.]|jgi:23S rRNA (adenine2503-C2)-methyltransferase|nr:23S rRNA (adenine(2503)-C(2))-methyltransferase RlmN [Parachlamydia sp.]
MDYGDLDHKSLIEWLKNHGEREFHAKQIFNWIFQKGVLSWDEMSNLGVTLRQKLSKEIRLPVLEFVKSTASNDNETVKFLWRLKDGNLVESVLILSGSRRTVCVSSQVGCPAKCSFCASGQQGFFRNLRPTEIIEQVLQTNKWLAPKGEKVTHVVYMGMGEPLKNYESVMTSIRVLTHPDFCNISQRRITVSTVGVVEGIKRLSQEGLKVNLVLSLHAPNQHIRKKIIPYARKYPLEDILAAMDEYAQKTKRDITYEYTLLAGINDHPDHAHELAHLLKGKQCTVNLIPYNPVGNLRLKRPDKKTIKQFRAVLFGSNIVNTCRYTKGDDISAACGQLAMQERGLPLVKE